MGTRVPKIVTSAHYHVWTDALHARALARQAHNRWDRGAYVRWAVNTAWTAFEIACEDALRVVGLGNRFRERLDKSLAAHGLPPLQWGSGTWQRVLQVYNKRKAYTHHAIAQADLFAQVSEADRAITILREGISAIFAHTGKTPPPWVQDDEDRGWDDGRDPMAYGTVVHQGASDDDSNVIRVAYVVKDREHVHCLLPPSTDPEPHIAELVRATRMPISTIRLYRGHTLIDERELLMRGV